MVDSCSPQVIRISHWPLQTVSKVGAAGYPGWDQKRFTPFFERSAKQPYTLDNRSSGVNDGQGPCLLYPPKFKRANPKLFRAVDFVSVHGHIRIIVCLRK